MSSALVIKKILVSDVIDQSAIDILKQRGFDVDVNTNLTKQQLLDTIKDYDALIVRSSTKVTEDVIQAGKQLKVIGRAGVGVDNIDVNAATKQGVIVINSPSGSSVTVAELTCGLILSLARHIPNAATSIKNGVWDRKSFMGTELQGKTLAIVGLGRIGREVAVRMQAFGMKTVGFDPLVPQEISQTFGVNSFPLEQLWPQADYITLHVPLIPQTKHMVNEQTLSKCRKGVKIINVARGGTINEQDLLTALQSGQVGGAALDVYENEPPKNTDLLTHPNLIGTPHMGASTKEAQRKVAEEIATQFIDLTNGKKVQGQVN